MEYKSQREHSLESRNISGCILPGSVMVPPQGDNLELRSWEDQVHVGGSGWENSQNKDRDWCEGFRELLLHGASSIPQGWSYCPQEPSKR